MKLDGRPMSGDIGRGATRDVIAFARKLASAGNKPKGIHIKLIRLLLLATTHCFYKILAGAT